MKLTFRLLLFILPAAWLTSCSSNNVHENRRWEKYFEGSGFTGSFLLHNSILNTFYVYNLPGSQVREIPGATFDLMNAMAALETGVARDTAQTLRDSLGRPIAGVDSALTLAGAFRTEDRPYFCALARRVGKPHMQFWLDSTKYGNMVIGAYVDSFWVNNTLKISPDEQMGFMQQLYAGKLPFQSRTQRLAKALLLREKNLRYQMSYASAFFVSGERKIGWISGWISENDRPHFFVLEMASRDTTRDVRDSCFSVLHQILDEEGYFKK